MGDLLLGVDVGTASTKGVLVRPDGTVLAQVHAEHGMDVPRPGWAEQDADAVWWSDVVAVIGGLASTVPSTDRIAGVAVSAIGPCLLPLDAAGRPLRPAILYGVDTRATKQIVELEERYGRQALEEVSGMRLSSQAVGPKIRWLREHESTVFSSARWFVTATTYLVYRLTGEMVVDPHTASHFNPLFDPTTLSWTDRFADGLTPLDRLPPVGWPATAAGAVSPDAAAATGLRAGTPVAVGTVDALAEAVSVGVVEPGDLMIMHGSTTFLILVAARPVPAGDLWMTAGIEEGRWALATSGSAMAWFRDRFAADLVALERAGGPNAFDTLAAEAARATGGGDLLFLPYLSGERTPINDPHARGVLAGLSLHTTRGDMYRALLDGVAHAVRANLEAMRALGVVISRVRAVGGGTANRLLMEAVSSACGIDQEIPSSTIGAARGDAFLAGLMCGVLKPADLAGWIDTAEVVRRDPARAAVHDPRHRAFRGLYEQTRPTVHELSGAP